MSKLKYMLGALGLSMALIMTGCGAAGGSQNTDSSVAAEESSTSAETAEKADDSQADASADQEEEKEPSHDLTGADAEGYIHDASYEARANAAAGSLEQPYGRYRLKDADGVFYYFDGDGTCYYVQKGTYSFSHDASTDGTDEDMISMQFGVQETPTNYIIDEEDGQLMIRTTYSGKEAETQVMMNLIDGTDGIAAMEPFEGIYTAYGSDVYRYEFHADGSFYLILEENYSLDGNKVTLKAFEREFNYEYAENGGNLELSGDGTTIATLIPMDL